MAFHQKLKEKIQAFQAKRHQKAQIESARQLRELQEKRLRKEGQAKIASMKIEERTRIATAEKTIEKGSRFYKAKQAIGGVAGRLGGVAHGIAQDVGKAPAIRGIPRGRRARAPRVSYAQQPPVRNLYMEKISNIGYPQEKESRPLRGLPNEFGVIGGRHKPKKQDEWGIDFDFGY